MDESEPSNSLAAPSRIRSLSAYFALKFSPDEGRSEQSRSFFTIKEGEEEKTQEWRAGVPPRGKSRAATRILSCAFPPDRRPHPAQTIPSKQQRLTPAPVPPTNPPDQLQA